MKLLMLQKLRQLFGEDSKYSVRRTAEATILCEGCELEIEGRYDKVVQKDGNVWNYHGRCLISELRDLVIYEEPEHFLGDLGRIEDEGPLLKEIPQLEPGDKKLRDQLLCRQCRETRMEEILTRGEIGKGEKVYTVWYRCLNPECGYVEFT